MTFSFLFNGEILVLAYSHFKGANFYFYKGIRGYLVLKK